jgi:hypothetical protein
MIAFGALARRAAESDERLGSCWLIRALPN